jgi:hypothetical protein
MAEYNFWKEVGTIRMPVCYAVSIYLANKTKSIDRIVAEIRKADKNYLTEIEEEAKISSMQVNKTYDNGARRSRR